MYQGETITVTITGFPISLYETKSIYVVFRNKRKEICLEITDVTIVDDATCEFKLTQEESLLLDAGIINRSVIIVMPDGSRMESIPSAFKVDTTAKDVVLE